MKSLEERHREWKEKMARAIIRAKQLRDELEKHIAAMEDDNTETGGILKED